MSGQKRKSRTASAPENPDEVDIPDTIPNEDGETGLIYDKENDTEIDVAITKQKQTVASQTLRYQVHNTHPVIERITTILVSNFVVNAGLSSPVDWLTVVPNLLEYGASFSVRNFGAVNIPTTTATSRIFARGRLSCAGADRADISFDNVAFVREIFANIFDANGLPVMPELFCTGTGVVNIVGGFNAGFSINIAEMSNNESYVACNSAFPVASIQVGRIGHVDGILTTNVSALISTSGFTVLSGASNYKETVDAYAKVLPVLYKYRCTAEDVAPTRGRADRIRKDQQRQQIIDSGSSKAVQIIIEHTGPVLEKGAVVAVPHPGSAVVTKKQSAKRLAKDLHALQSFQTNHNSAVADMRRQLDFALARPGERQINILKTEDVRHLELGQE